MSIKRRMGFNLLCLGLVLILSVTSISLILSAINANVNSGFSVVYTPKNVNASVAGSYNKSGTEKNMTIEGQEGILNFDETHGGGSSTL